MASAYWRSGCNMCGNSHVDGYRIVKEEPAIMSPKRKIKAKDLVRDIRSGITTSQLIEKYGFSAKGLRLIFGKLLEARVMTRDELNTLTTLDQNPEGVKGVRRAIRKISPFPVRIYDNAHPFATGYGT